jgi:hypothetical protein
MKTTTLFSAFVLTLGLVASSVSFAQVKIGTNPTTIDPNNNLEVEASTPGRKTAINKTTGQVTIADGTQGNGKVFTSDANGGGSWQATQLVKAIVSYVNDGVATVNPTTIFNYANAAPGNVNINFPENGVYAVSWSFIADAPTFIPAGNNWYGILLGTVGGQVLNHQDNLIGGSQFVFSSGSRYVTITNAPVTYEVRYLNSSPISFTTRSNSSNNYNAWFGYKVF